MKSILHKTKLKFSVGQKVYYKHTKKVRSTTIKRIDVKTVIKKNKDPITSVDYVAFACRYWTNCSYYKVNRSFKEDQLYTTEEAAAEGILPTEKTKIERLIKKVKNNMTKNRKTIKAANAKLAEIRKEELIEQLSGI